MLEAARDLGKALPEPIPLGLEQGVVADGAEGMLRFMRPPGRARAPAAFAALLPARGRLVQVGERLGARGIPRLVSRLDRGLFEGVRHRIPNARRQLRVRQGPPRSEGYAEQAGSQVKEEC